jgi:sporulation protein YlmC with PRC-barrel domain
MTKIEIYPLKGINIENVGEVNLDQTKSEIESILGLPSSNTNKNRLYYDNLELRIDLDEFQKVEL